MRSAGVTLRGVQNGENGNKIMPRALRDNDNSRHTLLHENAMIINVDERAAIKGGVKDTATLRQQASVTIK